MHTLTLDTPAGPLTTIVDDEVVRAAGFTDDAGSLADRLGLPRPPPICTDGPVRTAILAWLAGEVSALDAVPVTQDGTDFQQQIWAALRTIPPGRTATYADLAAAIGRPGATRAAGSACGRNLLAPFVPCHRAVRSDGSLGGYRYGPAVKDWLLRHESGHS